MMTHRMSLRKDYPELKCQAKLKISQNKVFILCNEVIHRNLAAVQKNSIFKLDLTYPGILSVKLPSIPMFYTCKKTFLSVLLAHQI